MAFIFFYFPLRQFQVVLHLRILRHKCKGPCKLFDGVPVHLLADAEEVLLQVSIPCRTPPKAFSLLDGKIATGMKTKEELAEELTEELTDVRVLWSRAQSHFSEAHLLSQIDTLK